eukprot:4845625-Alexandrium_andersonii.AAC.1
MPSARANESSRSVTPEGPPCSGAWRRAYAGACRDGGRCMASEERGATARSCSYLMKCLARRRSV